MDASAVRVWVPRHTATRPTLNNSVAGGIAGVASAFDVMLVKEGAAEASLDPELVHKRAHAARRPSTYAMTILCVA